MNKHLSTITEQLQNLSTEDPLAELRIIATLKQSLQEEERKAVLAALKDHNWREVGEALGVSKQAVFQRFGKEWVQTTRATVPASEVRQVLKSKLSRKG